MKPDVDLIVRLLNGEVTQEEFLVRYGAKLTIWDLGPTWAGVVYVSKRGRRHILINRRLTRNDQQRSFLHEIDHLLKVIPRYSSILSLDMQHSFVELSAEEFAQEIAIALNIMG